MTPEYIAPLLTGIGALVAAFFSYRVGIIKERNIAKKQDDDSQTAQTLALAEASATYQKLYDSIYDKLDEDNKQLRGRVKILEDNLDKKVKEYDSKISSLLDELEHEKQRANLFLTKLALMESVHKDLPIPYWVKIKTDRGFVMYEINDAYELSFLAPTGNSKLNYIDKTDVEYWGPEIGESYAAHDWQVFVSKKHLVFKEKVQLGPVDQTDSWIFMKFPFWDKDRRHIIGVAGLAFPMSTIMID